MKKLNILVATLMFTFFTSVKAEIQFGLGIIAGQTDVSGTERRVLRRILLIEQPILKRLL